MPSGGMTDGSRSGTGSSGGTVGSEWGRPVRRTDTHADGVAECRGGPPTEQRAGERLGDRAAVGIGRTSVRRILVAGLTANRVSPQAPRVPRTALAGRTRIEQGPGGVRKLTHFQFANVCTVRREGAE